MQKKKSTPQKSSTRPPAHGWTNTPILSPYKKTQEIQILMKTKKIKKN
jgi:hypothetical protein